MRPYRVIKSDVEVVLRKIPEILGITHVNAHWVERDTGYGTFLDVAIVVKPDMTVRDVHKIARKARRYKPTHFSLPTPTASIFLFYCLIEKSKQSPMLWKQISI